jgi:hypothetical protein
MMDGLNVEATRHDEEVYDLKGEIAMLNRVLETAG